MPGGHCSRPAPPTTALDRGDLIVAVEVEAEEAAARAAAQQAEAQAALAAAPKEAYQRREGVAYAFTPADGQPPTTSLLDAPMPTLIDAVTLVVRAEGPVHLDDVAARVTALWDTWLESRIQGRIEDACSRAAKAGAVIRRGDFLYHTDNAAIARWNEDSGRPGGARGVPSGGAGGLGGRPQFRCRCPGDGGARCSATGG